MSVNGDPKDPPTERERPNRFSFLEPAPDLSGAGHSGRGMVILSLSVMFAIAATLFGAYQVYLAQYRELVAFGMRELAPVIDEFSKTAPAGLPPESWRRLTSTTRRMVEKVVRSGVLDESRLTQLSRTWRERAEAAKPETALIQLTRVWIEMETAAGPKIATTRQGDPKDDLPAQPDIRSALALALTIPPLENRPPHGVNPDAWANALADTRWMLAAVFYSQTLSADQLADFAKTVRARAAKIAANPDSSGADELLGIWDDAQARAPEALKRPDAPARPSLKP